LFVGISLHFYLLSNKMQKKSIGNLHKHRKRFCKFQFGGQYPLTTRDWQIYRISHFRPICYRRKSNISLSLCCNAPSSMSLRTSAHTGVAISGVSMIARGDCTTGIPFGHHVGISCLLAMTCGGSLCDKLQFAGNCNNPGELLLSRVGFFCITAPGRSRSTGYGS